MRELQFFKVCKSSELYEGLIGDLQISHIIRDLIRDLLIRDLLISDLIGDLIRGILIDLPENFGEKASLR